MRIPKNIEWRAGVILVGVAAVFLGLLVLLTLPQTHVGLEVEGEMHRTKAGWTITVEVPGERLRLLRSCTYVRFEYENGRVLYGEISRIDGCLLKDRASILAVIDTRDPHSTGVQTDSSQIMRTSILERRNVPVLRVLLDSIMNRPSI